jgi:hypothetical protein
VRNVSWAFDLASDSSSLSEVDFFLSSSFEEVLDDDEELEDELELEDCEE